MNQKENRIFQRKRILKKAKQLFLKNSYEKTTIRQISKELDLKIGSLYNFYKSKEDILLHLAQNMFEDAEQMAQKFVNKTDDELLVITVEIAIYLYAIKINDQLVALYISAYSSYPISRILEQK